MKKVLFTISLTLLLVSISHLSWARSTCQCYLQGKNDGRSDITRDYSSQGDSYELPYGCEKHIMGPMTPYRGGYFDGKISNRDYLIANNWCNGNPKEAKPSPPPRAPAAEKFEAINNWLYTKQQLYIAQSGTYASACSCNFDSNGNPTYALQGSKKCSAGVAYQCVHDNWTNMMGWSMIPGAQQCHSQSYCSSFLKPIQQ